MLTLYDYYKSSACFRVRIALALKKIPFHLFAVQLNRIQGEQHQPKYLNINPQGLVPALEAGDHIITQSLAIIEYLEEMHPTPALLPRHPYDRALARAFAQAVAADIHPLTGMRVTTYLETKFNADENQTLAWIQHWITTGLEALEKQIRMQALARDFCYGDNPGLADICLVPQLYAARRFACDLTQYPQLTRIESNCQRHPAFMQAWPLETVG